ncbi:MAG: MFS transporter [Pseudomonadota bacterium]
MTSGSPKRAVWAWSLYDWANSAFSTTVMAGFFPVFFKQYWSGDASATTSTFYLGLGNSLASLLVVLLAPLLGALADRGSLRKRMLCSFASLGAFATAGLFLVGQGQWVAAVCLYVLGALCFAGANVFYDALLVAVSTEDDRHRVSALGYALGYLGGGLLFAVNVMMTLQPQWFGLADPAEGVRWSFLSVAVWWMVFTVPLVLFVDEPASRGDKAPGIRAAFASLAQTARNVREYPQVWWFLIAFWFYIDGVHTAIAMAADYGLAIGLPQETLITALLLVQFIGFPAALAWGRLADRIGALRSIHITIWVYMAVTVAAVMMDSSLEFYLIAAVVGLVQGGVQSVSRSVFSQLIPTEKAAEFFGFYNMTGKAAAVIGPLLVGVTAATTGNSRLGLLSILVLFVLGLLVLTRVRNPAARGSMP